jgi:hypothetical protein
VEVNSAAAGGILIPQVTIKTGFKTPDGVEEQLTEFICDFPGCPNFATQTLGFSRELRVRTAMCDEHAPKKK